MPQKSTLDAFLESAVAGNQDEAKKLLAEMDSASRADFFVAAMLGDAETIEAVLKRDPSAATRKGGPKNWDPLLYLSFSRFHRESAERANGILCVARALLANGADPNTYFTWQHDDKNKLPALWAAACEAHHPALARVLLEAGANPNDSESVYHAAEQNYQDCLELLVQFGANLSGPIQPWNNTPLYFILGHQPENARVASVLAGAKWLLEHGADPNAPSYEFAGRPVHLAAANGWGAEVFELLSRHGADIHLRRKDGRNAYALAMRHGNTVAADWLRAHGAETELGPADEFFAACDRGDETAVNALLLRHPDLIPSLEDNEKRIFLSAARQDRVSAVRLMLKAGMPIDLRGEDGQTALHWACWLGNIATVKILLAHGAPLEIKDTTYHAPPLGWACHGSENCRNPKGDYVAVVKALLAAGATPARNSLAATR